MKVSVIVPVYNGEMYLEQCLRSIQDQILTDFEAICVDDGSTDSTPEMLRKFAEKDKRFRVVTRENGGLPVARNTGIEHAQGEYIAFVDGDDFIDRAYLSSLVESADTFHADVAICGHNDFYEDVGLFAPGGLYPNPEFYTRSFHLEDLNDYSTHLTIAAVWKIMVRRDFVESHGIVFHPDLRSDEDLAYVYEVLFSHPSISLVNKCLYNYRRDGKNGSLSHCSRNCTCYTALRHIRQFVEQKGFRDELFDRNYTNLVAQVGKYALLSAVSSRDFEELLTEFQQNWVGALRPYRDYIAPENLQSFDVLSEASLPDAFFWVLDQFRTEQDRRGAVISHLQVQNDLLGQQVADAHRQVAETKESHSYKIGNALLKPLSALKHRGE